MNIPGQGGGHREEEHPPPFFFKKRKKERKHPQKYILPSSGEKYSQGFVLLEKPTGLFSGVRRACISDLHT